MTRRRILGWTLTLVGLALIAAAVVILFAPTDLGAAVAVSLPGGLLDLLGVVVLLAEGEWLVSGGGEDLNVDRANTAPETGDADRGRKN